MAVALASATLWITVPHHFATWLRTFGFSEDWKRFKDQLIVGPVVICSLTVVGLIYAPLTLLMLDVDRFKSVNDTYGHAAGDDVLRAVAEVLRAEVRTIDLPARQGGEEFVVLLPGTNADGGRETAERIRTALAAREVATDAGVLRVTTSVGVAEWAAPLSADELLDAADRALYAAKEGGRNRVVVAGA